jgi:mono/diheme cytochrome c family protein
MCVPPMMTYQRGQYCVAELCDLPLPTNQRRDHAMLAMNLMRYTLLIGLLTAASLTYADEAPDYSGAELFRIFCASCHGPLARGNGPVAKSLKVKVPDLTRIARRHGGEFPVEYISHIVDGRELRPTHGSGDMPVWGQELYGVNSEDPDRRARSNELIGRMVNYLRSIQR